MPKCVKTWCFFFVNPRPPHETRLHAALTLAISVLVLGDADPDGRQHDGECGEHGGDYAQHHVRDDAAKKKRMNRHNQCIQVLLYLYRPGQALAHLQLVGFHDASSPSTPATPRTTPLQMPLPTLMGGPYLMLVISRISTMRATTKTKTCPAPSEHTILLGKFFLKWSLSEVGVG